jgi:hypothetical protein
MRSVLEKSRFPVDNNLDVRQLGVSAGSGCLRGTKGRAFSGSSDYLPAFSEHENCYVVLPLQSRLSPKDRRERFQRFLIELLERYALKIRVR